MKRAYLTIAAGLLLAFGAVATATSPTAKEHVFETKPLGMKLSVKMIGPYGEPADLQIICLFRHKAGGDTYQGAAKDTNEHLSGILSALRDHGEFVGELGETILFTPPKGSIPAKQFMVIGLGDENNLSLDSLQDLSPSAHCPEPHLDIVPAPDEGPVRVEVEYRIDPAKADAFAEALRDLERIRRRDGAVEWAAYQDPGQKGRYVENFVVESWLEHLRQHERVTVSDRMVEDRIRRFHVADTPPVVTHRIATKLRRL